MNPAGEALIVVAIGVALTLSTFTVLPRAKPDPALPAEQLPPVEIVAVGVPENLQVGELTPAQVEQAKLKEIEVKVRHLTEQAARIERKVEGTAEGR